MRGQNDHPRNSKHNTAVVVVRVSFTYRILRTAYVVVTTTEFTLWDGFITKHRIVLVPKPIFNTDGLRHTGRNTFLVSPDAMRVKLNNWGKK